MYSMLIVDDEEIPRRGLRALPIWKSLGIRVVGWAENGEDALEQLTRLPVSILLTDVKMPRMDGLQLAERVRARHPHIRIVFVSGYDDVTYIRQALRMAAVDYILKPIDPQELAQCFRRVVDALDQERCRQGELQQLLDAYQAGMTFMQENLLGILLTSETVCESQLRQVAGVLHTGHENRRFLVAVLRVQFSSPPSPRALCGAQADAYCFSIDPDGGVYAFLFAASCDFSAAQCHAVVSALRDRLRRQGALRFFAACDDRPVGIWDIRQRCKRALSVLRTFFSLPDGTILSASASLPPHDAAPFLPAVSPDDLLSLFLSGDEKAAEQFLNGYCSALRAARLTCAADYIPLFSPLLRALDELLLQRFSLHEEDEMHFSQQLGALANAFCLDDMFDGVRRHYLSIRSMLLDQRSGETPLRIAQVRRYIRQHYAQPLVLDQIAREVSLAPTYLCLLFREETGQTLHAYMTEVRMEQARALLRDPSLKLYDVSQSVGYPNPSYFTRQFRKYTGMTPTEYRSRCVKGE